MAGVSATESALENQRIGGLQLRVAALCALVQFCDGYDLNSIAWAVPSLIREWHLPEDGGVLFVLGIQATRRLKNPFVRLAHESETDREAGRRVIICRNATNLSCVCGFDCCSGSGVARAAGFHRDDLTCACCWCSRYWAGL